MTEYESAINDMLASVGGDMTMLEDSFSEILETSILVDCRAG